MDCSTPGFPVLHHLIECAQTLHWFSDAIQSSHPLLSSSPVAFNLSQHQGLFQWVSSSQGGQSIGASASASVFPTNIQGWFPLGLTGLISCSPRDSQESSPEPQFESIHSSVFSLLYAPTLTCVHDYWKELALTIQTFVSKVMSLLFNMLSRFVIAFLSRRKCLSIS